ncbi:MAG: CorA family divalent cation transporter, partial [Thermoproteota archaeon]|nr:CorA family divalent cation transporter [Thermoproteota archaeon]
EIDLAGSRQINRDLSVELSNMKRSLLSFLNAVWATHDIVRNIKYGDPDMMTDDDDILEKFEVILATLDRQIQMAENVLEVISTGITAINTESSNQLTKLIVWLTVAATAVLVPNTLATIFGIPGLELSYVWVIPVLIFATALSSIITFRWTKQYRILPFGSSKLKRIKRKFKK